MALDKKVLHIETQPVEMVDNGTWARASIKYWFEGVPGSDKVLYYDVPARLRYRLIEASDFWLLVVYPFLLQHKHRLVCHGFPRHSQILNSMYKISNSVFRNSKFQNDEFMKLTVHSPEPLITYGGPGLVISPMPQMSNLPAGGSLSSVHFIGPNFSIPEMFNSASQERVYIHGLHTPLENEVTLNTALRYFCGVSAMATRRSQIYYTKTNLRAFYNDPEGLWVFRPLFEIAFGFIAASGLSNIAVSGNSLLRDEPDSNLFHNGSMNRYLGGDNHTKLDIFGSSHRCIEDRISNLSNVSVLRYMRHCMSVTDSFGSCGSCPECMRLRMAMSIQPAYTQTEKDIFGVSTAPILDFILSTLGKVTTNMTMLGELMVKAASNNDLVTAEVANAIMKIHQSKGGHTENWFNKKLLELQVQYAAFKAGKKVTLITKAVLIPNKNVPGVSTN